MAQPTFSILNKGAADAACDLLLAVVRGDGKDSEIVAALDTAASGLVSATLKREGFGTPSAESVFFPALPGVAAKSVLLVRFDKDQRNAAVIRIAAAGAARRMSGNGLRHLHMVIDDGPLGAEDAQALAEGAALGQYHYDGFLEKDRKSKKRINKVSASGERKGAKALTDAMKAGWIIAEGQNFARDLVNDPPNVFTPVTAVKRARALAKDSGLTIKVLNEAQCEKRGMGAFLAVNQGSAFPPSLVHLTWKPKGASKKRKKIVLVGKCLTFDSGGLCIKPASGMADMKIDMGGAAAVLGAVKAVADLQLNVEVHGIFAAAENMTGAAAYRTGDVLTASNGKTIEVLNTDAEGRLTLADALVYASALKPDHLIDLATLTGSAVVAVGTHYSALFSNDDELAHALEEASATVDERFWRLPLPDEYKSLLRSKVATLKNIGGRWAGSITAALFLSEFVAEGISWAHLDIAGPVSTDSDRGVHRAGATGEPVRSLVRFIQDRI